MADVASPPIKSGWLSRPSRSTTLCASARVFNIWTWSAMMRSICHQFITESNWLLDICGGGVRVILVDAR